MKPELIIIGGSAGSLNVILKTLPLLEDINAFAIVIVLHRKNTTDSLLIELLASKTKLTVQEAEEKEPIMPGIIYLAPANYHLLIEKDRTFSLDYSEKINYSRPCIDVTFQTAADVYGQALLCILLSGSNDDGTVGLQTVKDRGGITSVQNPETCEMPYMPKRALSKVNVDHIVDGKNIANFIKSL